MEWGDSGWRWVKKTKSSGLISSQLYFGLSLRASNEITTYLSKISDIGLSFPNWPKKSCDSTLFHGPHLIGYNWMSPTFGISTTKWSFQLLPPEQGNKYAIGCKAILPPPNSDFMWFRGALRVRRWLRPNCRCKSRHRENEGRSQRLAAMGRIT